MQQHLNLALLRVRSHSSAIGQSTVCYCDLRSLRYDSEPVYAGSMFVVDRCSPATDWDDAATDLAALQASRMTSLRAAAVALSLVFLMQFIACYTK